MTTANVAADKGPEKGPEKSGGLKVSEKLAERRRALGRGLESLLPGPRAVVTPAPTLAQSARQDGAPSTAPVTGAERAQVALVSEAPGEGAGGRAGTPVAPPETVDWLQASDGNGLEGEPVIEMGLDQILENPHQTRREFEPKALSDLAGSIQVQGVLQPIVVRAAAVLPGSPPRFILILGERRYRASKLAGKTTIPAMVKRVSEQQAAEMTLVENLQRQDLHCLEQAEAFANLSTEFRLTQEQIGHRVGVSREQVSNYMRLLKLPPVVIEALRKKEMTYTHARLLLALKEDELIAKVARVAIAKKMSVALLEEMVMNALLPPGEEKEKEPKPGGARWVDPNVRAAQRSLEAVLGMRVRIRDRKGKGKITIEYGTLEDFDRVVGMLKGK